MTPYRLADRAVFQGASDVIENRAEVVERFTNYLVAGEADDQVAAIVADADAGWVDENCVVGVAVLVFHFETPLFVSGFGPKPLSRKKLKGARSKQRAASYLFAVGSEQGA
ncbi:MAG: hypothetical protein NTV34_22035 [Proteobacteria bacterium]|nr:hypothetical protein [Pseudomonadota bacterium]